MKPEACRARGRHQARIVCKGIVSGNQKLPRRNPHIDSVSSDRFWSRFWTYQKPAIQQGPGRFREGHREANNNVNSQVKEYLCAVIYIPYRPCVGPVWVSSAEAGCYIYIYIYI